MKVPVELTGSHNGAGSARQNAGGGIPRGETDAGGRSEKEHRFCDVQAVGPLSAAAGDELPGMCEYCYLATTLGRRPYLRVYVNIDDVLAKARSISRNGRRQ
jgi:spore photoproduct lyase